MNTFNIGNQVTIKDTNEAGWIHSYLGSDYYMVMIKDPDKITAKIFKADVIELKKCENGSEGYCNFISSAPSAGQFACENCEIDRMYAEVAAHE